MRQRKGDVSWYVQQLSTERIIVLADVGANHRCGFTLVAHTVSHCVYVCVGVRDTKSG